MTYCGSFISSTLYTVRRFITVCDVIICGTLPSIPYLQHTHTHTHTADKMDITMPAERPYHELRNACNRFRGKGMGLLFLSLSLYLPLSNLRFSRVNFPIIFCTRARRIYNVQDASVDRFNRM